MASRRGRHQDDAWPAPELMCVGFVARVEQRETRVTLEQSRVSLRFTRATELRNGYRKGIGGRTTGAPSSASCGGGAGCACTGAGGGGNGWTGGMYAACAGGGLRAGGAAARGGGTEGTAATRGRAACSGGRASEALASVAFATSRAIWAWLVLSCAMLAFSSSTCLVIAARSCAIDCNCPDSAEGTVAAGAAGLFRRGQRCRLRARLLGCRGLIWCRGLNDSGARRLGGGRRFRGRQRRDHGLRRPTHSHRLGVIAIVLPRGSSHRAAQAQQAHDDPLSPFGCPPFARRHEVIDPDLIGPVILDLDIPDIGGAKCRHDRWGRSAHIGTNLRRNLDLRHRGGGLRSHGGGLRPHGMMACVVRERRRPVIGARSKDGLDRKHVVRIGLFQRWRGFRRLRGLHWRGPLLQCHPHLTMRRCCG